MQKQIQALHLQPKQSIIDKEQNGSSCALLSTGKAGVFQALIKEQLHHTCKSTSTTNHSNEYKKEKGKKLRKTGQNLQKCPKNQARHYMIEYKVARTVPHFKSK